MRRVRPLTERNEKGNLNTEEMLLSALTSHLYFATHCSCENSHCFYSVLFPGKTEIKCPLEDHFHLTTKTLLSLYYYYCSTSCSTFQTKCYAQNSSSHIVFCNIICPEFLLEAGCVSMEEKLPCATGAEMLNNVLWVQSLSRVYQNSSRFTLCIPFIAWA